MPYADVGRVKLCYEVTGPRDGKPLLLIHGLGAQLSPGTRFLPRLGSCGPAGDPVRNRDVGLSSKLDDHPSYRLRDMASDAVGLLDALGLDQVHVAGQSMGGMIAQELAISYPQRVRSLCSIYSAPSTGYLTGELRAILRGRRAVARKRSASGSKPSGCAAWTGRRGVDPRLRRRHL